MTQSEYMISRFDRAALLLPRELRSRLRELSAEQRSAVEEIRMRVGRPLTVLIGGAETEIGDENMSAAHINALLEIATTASPYSASDALKSGYITARGGFRIGLGGSVATENGQVRSWREFSSAAIRISREIVGCADGVMRELAEKKCAEPLLIISPPGCGKTTLLRDMARQLSDGTDISGGRPRRVGLCDERSEIAAMYGGRAQFDVGRHTDVIDACPKAEAAMMLLRAMNPEVIVMDEITAPEDIAAIERAVNCGVGIIATAHAESADDLSSRALYRRLLDTGVFRRAVLIRRGRTERAYEAVRL